MAIGQCQGRLWRLDLDRLRSAAKLPATQSLSDFSISVRPSGTARHHWMLLVSPHSLHSGRPSQRDLSDHQMRMGYFWSAWGEYICKTYCSSHTWICCNTAPLLKMHFWSPYHPTAKIGMKLPGNKQACIISISNISFKCIIRDAILPWL